MNKKRSWTVIFLIVPLVFLFVVNGVPLLNTIIKSFTNWDGTEKYEFVGLQNYVNLLLSEEFWLMLANSVLVLLYIPISVLIGIILSVLVFETKKSDSFIFWVYIPQIVSSIVAGKIFHFLFSMNGPVNKFFEFLGLNAIYFFGDRASSFFVIVLCLVWMDFGWHTVYFSGFLSTQSYSIRDTLAIDGANFFTKIFKIYIPMMFDSIKNAVFISVLFCFSNIFPLIFVMTHGGPGYDTPTIDYLIYYKSFSAGANLGEASALSVILLVFTIIGLFIKNSIDIKKYKKGQFENETEGDN